MVREAVEEVLGELSNIDLTEPLEYEAFVHLMKASYLILTDSGGIQEEAPSLKKPVLLLREVTERPEGVSSGAVRVVGVDARSIVEGACNLIEDAAEYGKMAQARNPYGDGRASERIIGALLHHFGFIDRRPDEFVSERKEADV